MNVVGLDGAGELLLELAHFAEARLDRASRCVLERRRRIQSFDRCRLGHGPLAPLWQCIILIRSCERRSHLIRPPDSSSTMKSAFYAGCTRSWRAMESR